MDIFDNKILCNKCNSKMQRKDIEKDCFVLRTVVCPNCQSKIIHPSDEAEYGKFINLRNKEFMVKMRLVGNSYAVSIPKEIVSFIREQETFDELDQMVRLCFQDFKRLSLSFGSLEPNMENHGKGSERNSRIIKAREVKIVRNNKPVLHSREVYDSANPERNKKMFKIGDK